MKTWARTLFLALALSSCELCPPGYYNGYPGVGLQRSSLVLRIRQSSVILSRTQRLSRIRNTTTLPHDTIQNLMVIRDLVGNIEVQTQFESA